MDDESDSGGGSQIVVKDHATIHIHNKQKKNEVPYFKPGTLFNVPDPPPNYFAEGTQAVGARGAAAVNSCPAAILLGLHCSGKPYAELIAYVRRCGGDTDTVAAMAGAVWGAYNGGRQLPEQLVRSIEAHGRLRALADALHKKTASLSLFRATISAEEESEQRRCEAVQLS